MSNSYDAIDKALDVKSEIVREKKRIAKRSSEQDDPTKDYEYSRAQLYDLVEKGQEAVTTNNKAVINSAPVQNQAIKKNEENMKNLDLGVKLELAELNISEDMKCTGQELFNALTRKDMIQIFTNSEAKMTEQAIEGGAFELLGGNISGKYIEVPRQLSNIVKYIILYLNNSRLHLSPK